MYARFSQAQLTRYADDWHGLVEWCGESDESDVPTVSVPERSLDLFEFLLTEAGSLVRLKENDEGVIRQPDDVERVGTTFRAITLRVVRLRHHRAGQYYGLPSVRGSALPGSPSQA